MRGLDLLGFLKATFWVLDVLGFSAWASHRFRSEQRAPIAIIPEQPPRLTLNRLNTAFIVVDGSTQFPP